jgi:hypothetical protein
MIIQRCMNLESFKKKCLFELFRFRYITSHHQSNPSCRGPTSIVIADEVIGNHWEEGNGYKEWIMKSEKEILSSLRELVDFEISLLSNGSLIKQVELTVLQRQDIITNRMLHHIQHLFEISDLNNVLGRLNEIYLEFREFHNFMKIIKTILGKEKVTNNTIILGEMLEIIQKSKSN